LALGPKTEQFEQMMASYIGVKHALAVSSGTTALHLIVSALGIGPGDEVLVPSFTFASSVNVILYQKATPVFVDIQPDTYNLDPDDVRGKITPRTRAIMAVDVFGHPAEWDALSQIAEEHNLMVIDDSCEALGAEYNSHELRVMSDESQIESPESGKQENPASGKWKKLGQFGDASAFAFYPNKQMTTGEGGIIVTDSDQIASICSSLRNQGRGEMGAWLEHERLGYNYRMTEMSAALGVSQLGRIEAILEKRAHVASLYTEYLTKVENVHAPVVRPEVTMSWFVYVITLGEGLDRNVVMSKMEKKGIPTRGYFSPMHLQPYIRDSLGTSEGQLPVTENIAKRTIALPFHSNLSEDEVRMVVEALSECVKGL
jgi:perosamine synthetase